MSEFTDETNAWFEIIIKIVKAIEYCKSNCIFIKEWFSPKEPKPLVESVLAYNEKNIMFNSHIDDILERIIHSESLDLYNRLIRIRIGDKHYKIPVISLADFSTNQPNSILDDELSRIVDTNAIDDNLIGFIRDELKRRVYDKPTYRLIDITGKLRIGVSSYFQTLSTSDVHYFNFIRELPIVGGNIDWNTYRNKNFLRDWQNRINEILNHNFGGYSASMGGAVLTIVKKKGEYFFFAKENSEEKNGGLDGHVSPSFMYQPSSENRSEQVREMELVNHQVVREFGEELLDMKRLQISWLGQLTKILNEYMDNKKAMKLAQLSRMINMENSGVRLFVTGLVLDIFRLRPEITFLLVIENDKFLSDFKVQGNWEAKGKTIKLYKVSDYEKFLQRDSSVPDLCAPGMAALVNGMEYAEKHIFFKGDSTK